MTLVGGNHSRFGSVGPRTCTENKAGKLASLPGLMLGRYQKLCGIEVPVFFVGGGKADLSQLGGSQHTKVEANKTCKFAWVGLGEVSMQVVGVEVVVISVGRGAAGLGQLAGSHIHQSQGRQTCQVCLDWCWRNIKRSCGHRSISDACGGMRSKFVSFGALTRTPKSRQANVMREREAGRASRKRGKVGTL